MKSERKIDGLMPVLGQIRARLAMLESAVPPELRDNEFCRRIDEVKVEEAVALAKLAELGLKPSTSELPTSERST